MDHLERYYTPDALARFCLDLLPWQIGIRVLEPHAGGGAFLRGMGSISEIATLDALDLDPKCWAHTVWAASGKASDSEQGGFSHPSPGPCRFQPWHDKELRRAAAVSNSSSTPLDPTERIGSWTRGVIESRFNRADFLSFDLEDRVYDRVVGNPPFSNAEDHVARALQVADECCFLLPVSRLDAGERVSFYRDIPLRKVWNLGERVWPGSRQIGFFWFDKRWKKPWWQTEVISWKY
jgi:hypothetical protein